MTSSYRATYMDLSECVVEDGMSINSTSSLCNVLFSEANSYSIMFSICVPIIWVFPGSCFAWPGVVPILSISRLLIIIRYEAADIISTFIVKKI